MRLSENRMLASALVTLALAIPASAGNLDQPHEDPAVAASLGSVDWSGSYAGIALGKFSGTSVFCQVGFSDDCSGNTSGLDLPAPSPEGGAFSLVGGHNWQTGSTVYGVELDISKINADGSAISTGIYNCGVGLDGCHTNVDLAVTLRGRIGVAINKWLPYVTAGVSAVRAEAGFEDFLPATMNTETLVLPVAGLGIEYRVNDRISLRGEMLHFFDRGDEIFAAGSPCGADCGAEALEGSLLRVGFNYHF